MLLLMLMLMMCEFYCDLLFSLLALLFIAFSFYRFAEAASIFMEEKVLALINQIALRTHKFSNTNEKFTNLLRCRNERNAQTPIETVKTAKFRIFSI